MDEMERRRRAEALQRYHRVEMQKQAGVRPLDTDPLPQTLAEKPQEEPREKPAEEPDRDYSIPDADVAAIEGFTFDSYQQAEPSGEPQLDVKTAEADTPQLASLPPQESQSVAMSPGWGSPPEPTPQQVVEPEAKNDSVSPTPPPQAPVAQEPATKDTPEPKPTPYEVRPKKQVQREPQTDEDREKRKQVANERLAIINQARQNLLQRHQSKNMQGNGFAARQFGGMMPNINVGADPENIGDAHQAFSDAGGTFAAVVAEALTMLTHRLNVATRRIAALEHVIDDGAS